MKRITIIFALIAAAVLPTLAYAQQNSVQTRSVPRSSAGQGANFGGIYYSPTELPPSGIRNNSRSFSDDFRGDVNVEVDTNPILACSGLDIRESIKGMLDMDSLSADVKNYLKSLLAKEALSLVYANPAIAGVLDGLKAFGNARFQLAQQSCEAIEGEISAESRFYRQQAFNNCMAEHNDTYKCSVETGNYVEGLNRFVNSAEARINNSVHNWTSRINIAEGPAFQSRVCANLNGYCARPDMRDRAEQANALVPDSSTGPDGKTKTVPSAVSPEEVLNEATINAQGAYGVYTGAMVGVASAYGGNIAAASRALDQLRYERKQEYLRDASRNNGRIMPNTAANIFNRGAANRMFISAERRNAASVSQDLQAQMNAIGFPLQVWQHPDIGNGQVGSHGSNSDHYHGLAVDFNCNNYSGGERACLEEAQRRIRSVPGVRFTDIEVRADGGMHLHVSFNGPRNESTDIRNFTSSAFADAEQYVRQISANLTPVRDAATPDAKLDALRQAMKDIPLIPEDACFYELDANPGLDDIRNITEIFGLNSQVNSMVQRMARGGGDEETGDPEAGARMVSSLAGKIQALNVTIGRLAYCNMVTSIDPTNLMKVQYITQGEAYDYLRSLSLATAGQAALSLYDAVIYQTNMARIMAASDSSAPPSVSTGFEASIEMLESMRDALKSTLARQDTLAARQRSLDTYLQRRANEGAVNSQQRARSSRGVVSGGIN